jgi:hypothetical protein
MFVELTGEFSYDVAISLQHCIITLISWLGLLGLLDVSVCLQHIISMRFGLCHHLLHLLLLLLVLRETGILALAFLLVVSTFQITLTFLLFFLLLLLLLSTIVAAIAIPMLILLFSCILAHLTYMFL